MNALDPKPVPVSTVAVEDAEARFAELLARAEAGERIVITRAGRPVAQIAEASESERNQDVSAKRPSGTGLLGAMRGQIWIADDFDELGPEWDDYVR